MQAQKRWTTIDGEPTAEPMEVDALGKGKSKGKDKGKSKSKDKGTYKGKGKSKEKSTQGKATSSGRPVLATTATSQGTWP